MARYVESHALYRDSRKILSSSVNGPATLTSNSANGFAANSHNKANSGTHTNNLSQWHSNLMPSSSLPKSSLRAKEVRVTNAHDMYKNGSFNVNGDLGGKYMNSQLGMPETIV